MISFEDDEGRVVLVYRAEQSGPSWLDPKLASDGEVTLSRTFTVRKQDLLPLVEDEDTRRFVIGAVEDPYRRIRKDVLSLKHDLLLAQTVRLRRRVFVAERNISIFRRVDHLVDQQIVVGGADDETIPVEEFERLLHDFPTSTELTKYSHARITRVIREYLEATSDAEQRLADYMDRRARSGVASVVERHEKVSVATQLELEKFTYVRDRLAEMLGEAESYKEACWQSAVADLFLLIFPQYVAVLHNVKVKDQYSNDSRTTARFIDLMLVGADGCVDIIEIKRPTERSLVSKRTYRDNHIPVRDLSGALTQAEKYLFYLSKAGRDSERDITTEHADNLPQGLEVRIVNPKAFILSGRDVGMEKRERFDFEFARRAYANVVDIISYDDLLRRIDNIIESLTSRAGSSEGAEPSVKIGESE